MIRHDWKICMLQPEFSVPYVFCNSGLSVGLVFDGWASGQELIPLEWPSYVNIFTTAVVTQQFIQFSLTR